MTNKGTARARILHLQALRSIAESREQLERDQFAAVLDARLAGAHWAQIGDALGITAQAVQKRYAPSSQTDRERVARDRSRDRLYTEAENAQADERVQASALALREALDRNRSSSPALFA